MALSEETKALLDTRPRFEAKDRIAVSALVVSALALVISALSLLLNAYVAERTLDLSRMALVASNRAFITPVGMRLTGPVEAGKELPFDIIYLNSGRTTAIFNRAIETIAVSDPAPAPNGSVIAGRNPTCDGLSVFGAPNFSVTNDTAEHWFAGAFDRDLLSQEVVSGQKALVVRGCFKYSTLEELHRSEFCYVARIGDRTSDATNTIFCKDGNFSD